MRGSSQLALFVLQEAWQAPKEASQEAAAHTALKEKYKSELNGKSMVTFLLQKSVEQAGPSFSRTGKTIQQEHGVVSSCDALDTAQTGPAFQAIKCPFSSH